VAGAGKGHRGLNVDRWQYMFVLTACLVITAPLEFVGTGVYRQPWRTARSLLPVAAVFIAWDVLAVAGHVWTYDPRYVTGVGVGLLPLEELLFFLVIPICGLLTYSAVNGVLARTSRIRASRVPPT
jgi:lycopene cyclase domain-containing protein